MIGAGSESCTNSAQACSHCQFGMSDRVHGNHDGRIDRIIPGAPRNHAAHICIAGLPAGMDRDVREIEVACIGLAVDRLGVDLHQMHRGSATQVGEFLDFRHTLAFFGKHVDEFADGVTHPMNLGLPRDMVPGTE